MIYGNYAKQYGASNYKIVSESDAILEYMFSEAKQYQNLILTESFFDDEERMVMEAKYEVLQEAISVALEFAIGFIIGTIIALILKFIGLLNDGSSKLKNIFNSIGKLKDLNDEEKKKFENEIHELISNQNFKDKEKLFKFSNDIFEGIPNTPINELENLIDIIEEFTNKLKNIFNSNYNSEDEYLRVLDPIKNKLSKQYEKFIPTITRMEEQKINVFIDHFSKSGKYDPVESRIFCKQFIEDNYYNKVVGIYKSIVTRLKKIETFLKIIKHHIKI